MSCFRRGIRTLCSRKIYFFMLIVVPLAGAFFFLSLMHEGLPTRIPSAIVDLDHSQMSRRVTRSLACTELIDITETKESYSDAINALKAGEIYGFFYIPQNFQKQALAGEKPTLSFVTNMSIYVPGTLAYKGFKTQAVTTSGGLLTAVLAESGAEAALGLSSDSLMPLNMDYNLIGNPWMNYSVYLSQSFLAGLIALLAMVMTVFSITEEIKWQTSPEWLASAHGSMGLALLSKLLPQTVILSAVGVAIQAVMFEFLYFPIHCPAWHMVLAMVLLVASSQGFAAFIAEIVPNVRMSLIVVSLTSILAFSVAGFSFPVDKMYGAVGIFAYILPIRYYFLIYIDQALNGIPLYYSRIYYIVMLGMILLPLLGLRRLRGRCLRPVYVP
ncbi:MAG: ABC transporter permease [Duncaniella sp.]|nr:ABC transporter permease [Duncaniella sp.]